MSKLKQTVLESFSRLYNGDPTLVCSPGRINLIGEHTDYNSGFVLPAAINRAILLALSPNNRGVIRLHSVNMEPDTCEVALSGSYVPTGIHWADYIVGVVDELQKAGYAISGFDCVFGGDVPIGAGLSSSAALEGGIVYGLSKLFGLNLSLLDMSRIAMKAENNFVGVQCGIMDQFASLHGKKDSVIKLDCRSLSYEYYPFQWDSIRVLLCDTRVRRTLAGSEYNIRRAQCEKGVRMIAKSYPDVLSLRDVSLSLLDSFKEELESLVYRRCRYVLNENQRVTDACQCLLKGDLEGFGQLMFESHYGLRDEYQVSCRELDVLVEAAESLDVVLGSRMMGGGFGGCTVNLVVNGHLEESMARISEYYSQVIGSKPEFHVVDIGAGTHLLPLD